jgi:predicted permease
MTDLIATALAPILALILIGYGLRRFELMPAAAWAGIEKLTYFVLFPALLIRTLGKQAPGGAPWLELLVIAVGTLTVAAAVLLLWYRWRQRVSGPTFTSVFQGGVRFNTYIALAVAQAFYGPQGLAMGVVAAGFMIVLINLLCIAVFTIWGDTGEHKRKSWIREVFGNPLIVSCVLGWLLSLTGVGLPGVTDDTLEILGRAALPIGLLAVGAALHPAAVRGHVGLIAVASAAQFGIKPFAAALLIHHTGLSGAAAGAVFIAFITPTASSGAILARQLGGDTETMASIITFQTVLAFAAMPALALLLPA